MQMFLYSFICVELLAVVQCAGDQLLQVHVIFRHGDRSPIASFPKNPVSNTTWKQGFGQLSQKGMMQHYELGRFLRSRYIEGHPYKLINESYLESEVYVRSTDLDRTLMSTYSNLAALFPPTDWQIWNKNLSWQPIPVHTVPAEEDYYLIIDNDCPRYNEIRKKIFASEEVKKREEEYKELFEYVYMEAGLSGPGARRELSRVTDALFCQEQFGYPLPDWAQKKFGNETVYEKLRAFKEWEFSLELSQPGEPRYKGGPFIGLVLSNMTDIIKSQKSKKFFMYSSHDTTLIGVLSAMFVYNRIIPPYASCIIFELLRSAAGGHLIRVLYRNDSAHEPYPMNLPGCGTGCTLEQFINLTRPNVPLDYLYECQTGFLHLSTVELALSISLLLVSLLSLTLCARLVLRSRRSSSLHHDIDGTLYMKLNNVIDE